MAKRLYFYLANYKTKSRINFEMFMRRFFKLLYGSVGEKNKVAFEFYNFDRESDILSSLAIYDLYQYYEKGSKLHEEATVLVDEITKNSKYVFTEINSAVFRHSKKSESDFNYNYYT